MHNPQFGNILQQHINQVAQQNQQQENVDQNIIYSRRTPNKYTQYRIGNSRKSINNYYDESINNYQDKTRSGNTSNLLLYALILLAIVLSLFCLITYLWYNTPSSILQNTFLTKQQQNKVINLLKPLNLNQHFVKSFSQKNPQTKIKQLNSVLLQTEQFILFALNNSTQKYIFGVYGNIINPKISFVFNLNKQTKLKIEKPHFLLQIDGTAKTGPVFGKLDLSLFESSKYNNCKTQFCFSFQCPQEVSYSSSQANSYLAGSKEFHIDEIFILTRKEQQASM